MELSDGQVWLTKVFGEEELYYTYKQNDNYYLCRYDFEKQKEISMQLPDDFVMEGGIVDEIFFYEKTGKGKKYYKAIDIKQLF